MTCFRNSSHECVVLSWRNIKEKTKAQKIEKKFIYADKHCEIALYSLKPKETVPREIHTNATQIIRVEAEEAKIILNDTEVHSLGEDGLIVVPANTWHTIKNTSSTERLHFSTTYTPAIHH